PGAWTSWPRSRRAARTTRTARATATRTGTSASCPSTSADSGPGGPRSGRGLPHLPGWSPGLRLSPGRIRCGRGTMANCSDVVVGIDDSPESVTALHQAAAEAALRSVGLRAIHIWHYPSTWGVPLNWPAGANPGEFVLQRLTEVVNRAQAAR